METVVYGGDEINYRLGGKDWRGEKRRLERERGGAVCLACTGQLQQ
jgi:hypothetical protein